jgi:hypothetical protein
MRRLILVLPAILLTACASGASAPAGRPPVPNAVASGATAGASVTVRAVERRFLLPAHWPSGWVTVTLLNDGAQPHQLQLARLRPGASAGTLRSAFLGSPAAAFAQLELAGGPDTVEPGTGQQVTVRLDRGSYVALDLSVGPDGVQNVKEGMLQPFEADQPPAGGPPLSSATLVERSFRFEVPAISARPSTLEVRNDSGMDAHEAAVVQPATGQGLQGVQAFLDAPTGPPPFRFVGGMAALEAGQAGFLSLDLAPGSYVLLCAVTDAATGRFHFEEGMIQPFTVTRP